MDTDFFLIRKMKNGDEAAMEAFVRQYYPMILKYCRYHVPDAGYAEDLVQETFLRFFGALPAYRHSGRAANYLYRIAGNLCSDFYRRRGKGGPLSEMVMAEEDWEETKGAGQSAFSLDMTQLETRLDVEQALWRLPGELREVIVLHYFLDLKLREIARIQEVGLPLVKYRMREAKRRLAEMLEEN